MALLCGRYEGFDERIREHLATDAVSIGRYVLSGGELAAMVVADASCASSRGRLATPRASSRSRSPKRSTARRSTRTTPVRRVYQGWEVPEVLVSGDHERVREWRLEQSRAAGRPAGPDAATRPDAARRPLRFRPRAGPISGPRVLSVPLMAPAKIARPMSTIIESIEQAS